MMTSYLKEKLTTNCALEFILSKISGMDFDTILDYLCPTNPSFKNKIQSILPSGINLEELRDIAIFMHKILSIQMVHSLWLVYRRSGRGDFSLTLPMIHQEDRKIWPMAIRSLVKQQSEIPYMDEDHACLTLTNRYLHQLNDQNERYQCELMVRMGRLPDSTDHLIDITERWVQQRLQPLRLETNHRIAMVHHDYMDQILKRAFFAQNSCTENQIEIIKLLCQLKEDQEKTKYEFNLLKVKVSCYLTSYPFKHTSITPSSLFHSIHNTKRREQLYKQYKNIAERARLKMVNICIGCAKEQKQQCQKQYDIETKKLLKLQKSLPVDQRLTSSMCNQINQCLVNISARIQSLYQFKTQLFRLQSNVH